MSKHRAFLSPVEVYFVGGMRKKQKRGHQPTVKVAAFQCLHGLHPGNVVG